MPAKYSLNVSLTPKLEHFVQSRVAAGRYQTASEVVRDALRLLELQERDHDVAFAALKAKLNRASAQADRGEFVDPQAVLRKIEGMKRKRAVKA